MTRKSALIAEPNLLLSFALESMLVKEGFHVTAKCKTGDEAITAIQEQKPDIILTETRLNGNLNGIEMIRKVRKKFNIPVIFITTHSKTSIIHATTSISNSIVVTKPINYDNLFQTIEQILE